MPRNSARNPKMLFSRLYLQKKFRIFSRTFISGNFFLVILEQLCRSCLSFLYRKKFRKFLTGSSYNNKEPIVYRHIKFGVNPYPQHTLFLKKVHTVQCQIEDVDTFFICIYLDQLSKISCEMNQNPILAKKNQA